jgi:hypothetical protein
VQDISLTPLLIPSEKLRAVWNESPSYPYIT